MINNYRERTAAAARANFLNALTFADFDIIHTVKVHEKICEGGKIDYNDESEEINIKSATLTKKKDDKGGFKYVIKIKVE